MNAYDRSKILRSERGGALRMLASNMINRADMLPTKTQLRESLEEIYPGDEHGGLRKTLFDKLTLVAKEAQNHHNRFPLRGIVDELVLKVETKLADDDRLVPAPEEEHVDIDAIMEATDRYSDTIGGDLARAEAKEQAEAAELVRKAGLL